MPLRWKHYSARTIGDSYVIEGIEVDLKDFPLGKTTRLAVFADRIVVSGKVARPSGTIQLLAREIEFVAEGTLDVSATHQVDAQGKKKKSLQVGQKGDSKDGETGTHGSAGNPGGSVYLCAESIRGPVRVSANGGDAGDGGDGGNATVWVLCKPRHALLVFTHS